MEGFKKFSNVEGVKRWGIDKKTVRVAMSSALDVKSCFENSGAFYG